MMVGEMYGNGHHYTTIADLKSALLKIKVAIYFCVQWGFQIYVRTLYKSFTTVWNY